VLLQQHGNLTGRIGPWQLDSIICHSLPTRLSYHAEELFQRGITGPQVWSHDEIAVKIASHAAASN